MSATQDLNKLLDNLELASANRAIVRLQGSVDEVLHEDIPVIAARSAILSAFASLTDSQLTAEEARLIIDAFTTSAYVPPENALLAKLRRISSSGGNKE